MPWPFHTPKVDPKLMLSLIGKQTELAKKVVLQPLGFKPKLIAGVDSSLVGEDQIFSVVVVFTYPDLQQVEIATNLSKLPLPYIPGFLAFREVPNILKAYEKLQSNPDLLVVDGNGIIHKRKLGIACHLGVLLNKPAVGIAKHLLVGSFDEPGAELGESSPVVYKGEQVGFALRSRAGTKVVFVSPGHLIDLNDSLEFVKSVMGKYRLPEPTRIADKISKEMKPKPTESGINIVPDIGLFRADDGEAPEDPVEEEMEAQE